jgi:hypothetical protein
MKVEHVEAVQKDDAEAIRNVVKTAGAKSVAELTEAQKKALR